MNRADLQYSDSKDVGAFCRMLPPDEPVTYVMHSAGMYKIGRTTGRNLYNRWHVSQSGSPWPIHVLGAYAGDIESVVHDSLEIYRQHREWFAFDLSDVENLCPVVRGRRWYGCLWGQVDMLRELGQHDDATALVRRHSPLTRTRDEAALRAIEVAA
jgi:hypothetical protein